MSGIVMVLAAGARIGPVTASSNWGIDIGDVTNGSGTITRTLTVPSGNPGSLNFAIAGIGVVIKYQKNGGAATTVTDGLDVTFANSDTLAFLVEAGGGTGSMVVTVTDNFDGSTVGSWDVTIDP